MRILNKIRKLFTVLLLSSFLGYPAYTADFSEDISRADKKNILQQYDDAKEIYQKVAKATDQPLIKAYVHYRLGSIYQQQHNQQQAIKEYKAGLQVLDKAGQSHHQIAEYINRALKTSS